VEFSLNSAFCILNNVFNSYNFLDYKRKLDFMKSVFSLQLDEVGGVKVSQTAVIQHSK
jgi:hypothetical protein